MPNHKNLSEIVEEWLKQNGCHGLSDHGCCACHVGDLFPCESPDNSCLAAVENPCIPSPECGDCDAYADNNRQPLEYCLRPKHFGDGDVKKMVICKNCDHYEHEKLPPLGYRHVCHADPYICPVTGKEDIPASICFTRNKNYDCQYFEEKKS